MSSRPGWFPGVSSWRCRRVARTCAGCGWAVRWRVGATPITTTLRRCCRRRRAGSRRCRWGSWFACGVRSGGRVECWGDYEDEEDNSGQSPPPGWFESVAVAGFFSCGLRVDGEVECWGLRRDPEHRWPGWNADGGLWPQGPFTALGVGSYLDAICALRVGGEFVCWNDGSATHRAPQGAFVALDAGLVATCGLRPGGEAVCWGFDEGWERQHTVARPLDWDIPAGPFTAISVGDRYACALRPGGEAACWGHGKSRKSRGGVAERETLAEREIRRRLQPPPGPFVAISAGYNYTCGLRPGGEAACWGLAGTYSERELADPPPGPFVAISAGERRADDHACGLRPDDTAVCWDNPHRRTDHPRWFLRVAHRRSRIPRVRLWVAPRRSVRLRGCRQPPRRRRPTQNVPVRRGHPQRGSRLRLGLRRRTHLLGSWLLARARPTRAVHRCDRRPRPLLWAARRRHSRMLDTPLAPRRRPRLPGSHPSGACSGVMW